MPLIAVTAGFTASGPYGPDVELPARYVEAVRRAGGDDIVLVPVAEDTGSVVRRLERVDGILLTGGDDVDPASYGEETAPETGHVDRNRDALEAVAIRFALDRGLPLLAICRGIQMLNVALGGTLVQHLDGPLSEVHGVPGTPGVLHPIDLRGDSRLADALGTSEVLGTSHHHQALRDVSPQLRVIGRSRDGIVEAAEIAGARVLAVQWHPEDTAESDPVQQSIFGWLVREAARG